MIGAMYSNFPDQEFQDASHHTLSPAEWAAADWWRWNVLQPVRNELGPIRVTSFARDTGGAHDDQDVPPGNAIDLVPLAAGVSVSQLAKRFADTALAAGLIDQVIDERNHVHLARELTAGAAGGYLLEPTEGRYTLRAPPHPPGPVRALVTAAATGWIVKQFL